MPGGGVIAEVLPGTKKVWVNVQTDDKMTALYLELTEQSLRMVPGDGLWWDASNAYWTPQTHEGPHSGGVEDGCGVWWDIPIKRIGYDGAKHPAQSMIEHAYGKKGREV